MKISHLKYFLLYILCLFFGCFTIMFFVTVLNIPTYIAYVCSIVWGMFLGIDAVGRFL
jgi:hypothetical protein